MNLGEEKMIKKAILFGSVALMAVGMSACYSPAKDVKTVLVTGNYQAPRLLADVIQAENNQPYILLPNEADPRIMFVPAKRTGQPAYEIPPHKFAERVIGLNPKQVVLLGDEKYVPKSVEEQLGGAVTVVRVKANTWNKVAASCQSMMNLNATDRDFKRYYDEIQARQSRAIGSGVMMGNATNVASEYSEPGVVRQAPTITVERTQEVTPVIEIKEQTVDAEPVQK